MRTSKTLMSGDLFFYEGFSTRRNLDQISELSNSTEYEISRFLKSRLVHRLEMTGSLYSGSIKEEMDDHSLSSSDLDESLESDLLQMGMALRELGAEIDGGGAILDSSESSGGHGTERKARSRRPGARARRTRPKSPTQVNTRRFKHKAIESFYASRCFEQSYDRYVVFWLLFNLD